VRLIDRLLDYYNSEHYKCLNCFCDPVEPVAGSALEATP
jgi:hypothetical protein